MIKPSEWFVVGIAAVVSLTGTGLRVWADDCLPVVGRWSYGPTDSVEVAGSYAYFNSGAVLKIADLSDASQPVVVGEIDIEDVIEDLVVGNGHAFVVSHGSRYLTAIDVQDPQDPRVVGRLQVHEGWWVVDADLEIDGTMVYLGDHGLGFVAIDAADPRHPEVVGTYEPPRDSYGNAPILSRFAVDDGYVYVAAGSTYFDPASLRVIDFSSPSTPVEVGRIENPYFASTGAVSTSGDLLLFSASNGLYIVDISDPVVPVDVGLVAGHYGAEQIVGQGDLVYSAHQQGLRIYDVSDPSNPMFLANSLEGEAVFDVALGDHLAVVSLGEDGLQVLDVGDPAQPSVVGNVETPGTTEVIAAFEDVIYRVKDTRLQVFRVTSSGRPVELRSVDLGLRPGSIAVVDGEFLYLSVSRRQGIAIVSLSSPRHPRLKGLIEQRVLSFDVEDSKVYTWVSDTGFLVFDTTDPTSPVEIGRIDNPGGWYSQLSVSGRLAIALGGETSIRLIDVSDPANPYDIRSYGEGDESTISSVELVDGIAVLSAFTDPGGSRIRSYDLRDPSSPRLIDEVELLTWSSPGVLKFNGRRVVVNQKPFKVWAFEARSSGLLNEIDDWKFYPTAESIAVTDRSLHIALGPIGFVTHDLSMTCEPPRSGGGRVSGRQSP